MNEELQTLSVELLAKIATGQINIEELAKKELAQRGLNENGEWVGFGR